MPSASRTDRVRGHFFRRRALGTLLLLGSACASAEFAADSAAVFQCRDGSQLTVNYENRSATVLAGGHSYELVRKPSGVGERFASSRATLIIDGNFAAFVADELPRLRGCTRR